MPALIPSVRSQAMWHVKSSDILFGVMLRSVQAKRKSQRTCRQFEHTLSFFSVWSKRGSSLEQGDKWPTGQSNGLYLWALSQRANCMTNTGCNLGLLWAQGGGSRHSLRAISLSGWACVGGWSGYTGKGHSQRSGHFSWPLFYWGSSLAAAGFPTRSLAFLLSPSALFCRSDMLKWRKKAVIY